MERGGSAAWNLCKLRRCKPLKVVGPWRTAIRRYLSSLFLNHFSFIRRFEVVSDRVERRPGADIHKGHKTDSKPWCRLPRWLISTEHLSLSPLIRVQWISRYINICIHVRCVACNPFKDMLRWRSEALNPYNETIWFHPFKLVLITNSSHTLNKSRLTISASHLKLNRLLASCWYRAAYQSETAHRPWSAPGTTGEGADRAEEG